MPFEEVNGHSGVDRLTFMSAGGDGPPVVMLDGPAAPDGDPSLRTLWQRLPVPRVLVPAVLAALVLGGAGGSLVTYSVDHSGARGAGLAALQVRLDSEALQQGLDVYGLTRPALPLLIENRERTAVRVAELTWASREGRLAWYGDASAVDPGQQARIWGESEITCRGDGSGRQGLFAYLLVPGSGARTVRIADPGSVAVLQETVQRACG